MSLVDLCRRQLRDALEFYELAQLADDERLLNTASEWVISAYWDLADAESKTRRNAA